MLRGHPDADVPLVPNLVEADLLAKLPDDELRVPAEALDGLRRARPVAIIIETIAIVQDQQDTQTPGGRLANIGIELLRHDELTLLPLDRPPANLIANRSNPGPLDAVEIPVENAFALAEMRARPEDKDVGSDAGRRVWCDAVLHAARLTVRQRTARRDQQQTRHRMRFFAWPATPCYPSMLQAHSQTDCETRPTS